MPPFFAVVAAVVLDEHTGFGNAEHDFSIEAFVAQAAIKALDVTVLPGTARFDVEGLDPALGPATLVRGKKRPV